MRFIKGGLTCLTLALFLLAGGVAPAEEMGSEAGPEQVRESMPESAPLRYLPDTPKEMLLCQEKLPLDDQIMFEALDREFNIAVHDQAQVVMWMKRAHRYFPHISQQLRAAGMPDDLKYLAVAESGLLHKVGSSAGAVGVWQFMPATARRYGLRVDDWLDERRNFYKSTVAALRYLRDLHDEFGSWTLAMAGYNCGEARVRKELKEQGVTCYYDLQLPDETMRYVFRIASAKAVLEDPRKYGYALPADRLYPPIDAEPAQVSLKRLTHLRDMAKPIGSTVRRLRELNPEIRQHVLPAGNYVLLVPPGAAAKLELAAASLPACPVKQSDECRYWVVKRGDSLSLIAKRLGVSAAALRRANNIHGDKIKLGQRLVVPPK
ncbi:Lytic transglycosylase catalytic [Desulfarculus baarsii DSM 2075]|uniref:Lytic transglycosylase catalytic n=1 Tax=Desulfarculus baarsii (strain ATCC 33931 / DSM 2075 / LMG 7858 / VKM B-1802 / 2st14) TaxID=644282 RepID=E1QJQ3_DESB2|nr:lytic transglycosylase domain-containing protein [Desulfarculus baarsii]ADK85796.1 Lytic transglycosylase catalytic [Desulfarculus baarsii DSM 2075]